MRWSVIVWSRGPNKAKETHFAHVVRPHLSRGLGYMPVVGSYSCSVRCSSAGPSRRPLISTLFLRLHYRHRHHGPQRTRNEFPHGLLVVRYVRHPQRKKKKKGQGRHKDGAQHGGPHTAVRVLVPLAYCTYLALVSSAFGMSPAPQN
ncbi:hypothetical protein CKAH01_12526 [Colletotrichum kahawae]|uniref:Uncharacterized protein n=1 Tax=Colletotrichum kahawae TaxID=34407 RepID=A0AAD9YR04_COLKA|nr:hypothetical protein CKAH01_12526 [Colletotrichum kahawae]